MPDTTPPVSLAGVPEIRRRDLHFDLEDVDIRNWHPAGRHVSHFYNALSLTFPDGERFFIDTVRHYQDRITSPQLAADVRAFIGQEAMHGREHEAWNGKIRAAGLPADRIQGWVQRNIGIARRHLSPRAQLAATMALEHYTAEMADQLLADPRVLGEPDPKSAALWRWHAVEETEHKAVAFDVYREIHGSGLGAWWTRARVMWMVTIEFWLEVFVFHVTLVRADGLGRDWRGWLRACHYLWWAPGPLRRIPGVVWRYCRRSFHPWEKDNRQLVEDWKSANPAGLPAR